VRIRPPVRPFRKATTRGITPLPLVDLYLRLKYRDILKMIEKDGWRLVSQVGSHRQFKHPVKPGRVTVAGQNFQEAAPGTLNSILKQAGLKR
jgi:predicted RNA binding protein YcfA (HicA-like mRNA interferase family)